VIVESGRGLGKPDDGERVRDGRSPWPLGYLLVAAGLLTTLLGVLAVAAARTTPLPVDQVAHEWALAHRTAPAVAFALALSWTGTGLPAYALAAVAGGLAYGRRWWIGAPAAVLALLAGQGVRLALSAGLDRPRPPRADWATSAGGDSFPSGHTTTSAVVAALLCVALASRLHGRRLRLAQGVVLGWAVLVGLSRVYLGVHWLTDVIGGWLLAAALVVSAAAVLQVVTPRLPAAVRPPAPNSR